MNFWQKVSNRMKRVPFWAVGLTLGVLFLILGLVGEQLEDIYRKAVMICLECIGIG